MQCPECQADVRSYERNCVVCNRDVGYPNVRAASTEEERQGLEDRTTHAALQCAQRSCDGVFQQFQAGAGNSQAVICRSLGQVMELVSSDNALYASFYGHVDG